jgi:hypothetical protein
MNKETEKTILLALQNPQYGIVTLPEGVTIEWPEQIRATITDNILGVMGIPAEVFRGQN